MDKNKPTVDIFKGAEEGTFDVVSTGNHYECGQIIETGFESIQAAQIWCDENNYDYS